MNPDNHYDAVIVGAGLAGLAAAVELHRSEKQILLIEASDRVGGRLRTDRVDGFLLDHGFQVMLTAYSEGQELLDYDSLNFGNFEPGAYLWTGKKLEVVADPLRQPELVFKAIGSKAGTLADKLRIAKLKSSLKHRSEKEIYQAPETSSRQHLEKYGFSESMIQKFLAPFFSGIFLEPDLKTSSRMFDFVFKCFGQGYAALPQAGMAAIPAQLAEQLPSESILLNTRATEITKSEVRTDTGLRYTSENVIVATDMSNAAKFTNTVEDRGWNETQCFYFTSPSRLLDRKMIALNASGKGCIQNVSIPSDVSSGYSSSGDSLICVSTTNSSNPNPEIVAQELRTWFGNRAQDLNFLKSYWIPQALPRQLPGDLPFESAPLQTVEGIWLCGDYRYSSSIQGALRSGRKVASEIQHAPVVR